MTVFDRGIQLYLLVLAFIAALAIVWATNGFVLENTATDTGWPLLIGIAVMLVSFGVVIRHRRSPRELGSTPEQYPWTSRK